MSGTSCGTGGSWWRCITRRSVVTTSNLDNIDSSWHKRNVIVVQKPARSSTNVMPLWLQTLHTLLTFSPFRFVVSCCERNNMLFLHHYFRFLYYIYFLPTPFFVLCRVMLSVLLLVVRFGHWVCGESWHAIKGHRPSSQGWAPAFVCMYVYVCVCVYVCVWWFV